MQTTPLVIEIDGTQITPLSATIIKTMDTASDGWAAPIAWTPGEDKAIDSIVLPYKYPESKVWVDGVLQITGPLYTASPSLSAAGREINLEGASKTADIVDSHAKPPYVDADATLETRAKKLCDPHGIGVVFETSGGGPFENGMTIGATESKYSHLLKYASQRGILISSTNKGELLFWKAKTTGFPVASIEEGSDFAVTTSATGYAATYDGRKLFSSYNVIRDTQSKSDPRWWRNNQKSKQPAAISKDENIGPARFLTIQANETTGGDLQAAADHARSAIYAQALSLTLTVPGWRIPRSGGIWEVNTLVAVASETLMIPDGFTFMIRQVEFVLDGGSQHVNLSVVPPQIYSGEPIPYIWSV